MGFDYECIPNIQSLAREYFCPVCRCLVYPNEALQSLCFHLYCKPCLTYVVSTTRACPYDGYLVTEADSKPLTESNKALAETIGKIKVNCLYNKCGCTWQGVLTDSLSHCSGCAFGNYDVKCNRCGLQIVHRQVHEHAHTCPGVFIQITAAYQQYYQQQYHQYPRYDPYLQYYPYEQQAVAQYPPSQQQVPVQPQIPQSQPQLHTQ